MKHTDKLSILFNKLEASMNQGKNSIRITYLYYYEQIIKALINEGIIRDYIVTKEVLTIFLYLQSDHKIEIKRISKPGRRIYMTAKEINNLINSPEKIYLFSTSSGIITNNKVLQTGGELLCEIKQYVDRKI